MVNNDLKTTAEAVLSLVKDGATDGDVYKRQGYLCEACGNPIPEARRKIFPGVTLCVECQAYQERQRKHYA